MTEEFNEDRLRLEFQCDKDVRLAIEVIQEAFDLYQLESSASLTDLESTSGIDKSTLSKIVNGRKPNLTLLTIARVARALNRKMTLSLPELEQAVSKTNYVCYPELQNDWTVRVGRPTQFSEFGHEEGEVTKTLSKKVTSKPFGNSMTEAVGAS